MSNSVAFLLKSAAGSACDLLMSTVLALDTAFEIAGAGSCQRGAGNSETYMLPFQCCSSANCSDWIASSIAGGTVMPIEFFLMSWKQRNCTDRAKKLCP